MHIVVIGWRSGRGCDEIEKWLIVVVVRWKSGCGCDGIEK